MTIGQESDRSEPAIDALCEACDDRNPLPEQASAWSDQLGPSQQSSLARIIESRVIPKLLLARQQQGFKPSLDAPQEQTDMGERIGEFADLVIESDSRRATSYFQDLVTNGASVEALFHDLVAPTARRLGELWDEDINTMIDVTQGLGHLQHVVRTFSPVFRNESSAKPSGRRALLIPLPGEQHTLGISLVDEYFRREGWAVWGGPVATMEEVAALVGTMWFDMVGLSVARLTEPEQLAFDIRVIRKAARNRNLVIMVGGKTFLDNPQLAALVGAEGTASDGRRALLQLEDMISVAPGQY